jgi:hypothetical protein
MQILRFDVKPLTGLQGLACKQGRPIMLVDPIERSS